MMVVAFAATAGSHTPKHCSEKGWMSRIDATNTPRIVSIHLYAGRLQRAACGKGPAKVATFPASSTRAWSMLV